MRRPFVSGNLFLLRQVLQLFFQDFQFTGEAGNILLLLKNFLVHPFNGFVLKGDDRFQLDNSVFHALETIRIGAERELFNRLLR